jgi:Domain of unknown function (DUF4397)
VQKIHYPSGFRPNEYSRGRLCNKSGFSAFLSVSSGQILHHLVNSPLNLPLMSRPNRNFSFLVTLFGCLFFTSCLKNEDNLTVKSAGVALVNYSSNSGSVNLRIDNDSLSASPVAFPGVSGTPSAIYLPAHAGTRSLRLSSGSNELFDKNYTFDVGKLYSIFLFDSVRNGQAQVFILPDDTTSIDTLGRMRFLHLLPGTDTVLMTFTSIFRKDTLAQNLYYAGGITDNFPVTEKPGNYVLTVSGRANTLISNQPLEIKARDVLSIVLHASATGSPALTILRHRY